MPPEPENQNPDAATDTASSPPEAEKPLSPLLQAIKKPIPGANPCGQEINKSDDQDFQKIKEQIDKIGTVSATTKHDELVAAGQALRTGQSADAPKFLENTNSPNYLLIIDLARKILTEKSKDLWVGVYLCIALWKNQWKKERFAGLAEGLAVVNIIVQDFGEGWYPTRAPARKNIIQYLSTKLSEELETILEDGSAFNVDDALPLQSAQTALDELQKYIEMKTPQWKELLLSLSVVLEKCVKKIPKPSSGGAGSGTQPLPLGELKTDESAIDYVRKAANFWRGLNRKSVAPYRLVRSMRWDKLINEPPNDKGKTNLEAPLAQRRDYLNKLQQTGQWEKLLDEGEANFAQPPFHLWLDLQRLVVAALEALGGDYHYARLAILQELAILLQRVPQLSSLTFKDGIRFADAATQNWIDETVLPVLGSGEVVTSGTATVELESHMVSLFDEAQKLAARGDLAAAIAYLQEGATIDTSGKNRFRRRLYMATLCLRGGQSKMARPLLEGLSDEIDKFALAEWEPSLALEVWKNLYDGYNSLVGSAPPAFKLALQEQADRVFEKICRLDVSYALTLSGNRSKTKRPALPKIALKTPESDDQEDTNAATATTNSAEGDKKVPAGSDDKPNPEHTVSPN